MASQDSTTKVHETESGSDVPVKYPTLTIASHSDLDRIGDRFVFEPMATVALSRNEPTFRSRRGTDRALDDDYISRTPIFLESDALGNLRLEPNGRKSIFVNGQPLLAPQTFSHAALKRGLRLELTGRICLLIHETDPTQNDNTDHLGLVGESTGIARVRSDVQKVADLDVPVLIRGESGSGKELIANALHAASKRSDRPLIAVNMGALSPNLAAAELLGSVRGAYTGSAGDRPGYFRSAHKGTLFLDEIGETALEIQALLMRVLETGQVFPVGSSRGLPVDVRLFAATDANLENMARDGAFKAPLLHRLGAYEIWVPPLRRRRDDIMRLFIHFARGMLDKIRIPVSHKPWIPAKLAARLLMYHWPGNVRQLRNVVNQLIIDNRGLPQLSIGPRVERLLDASEPDGEHAADPKTNHKIVGSSQRRKPGQISAEELQNVLAANDWEPARAARALGISRSSIYNLFKKYEVMRKVDDLTPSEIQTALEQSEASIESAAAKLSVSVHGLRRKMKALGLT